MSNSKPHHPVGSHRRSSDRAEWSCVAGLKLRCAGRERCYPGRRQRQLGFFNWDWPEKSDPCRRKGPKISPQGARKCIYAAGPCTWRPANCHCLGSWSGLPSWGIDVIMIILVKIRVMQGHFTLELSLYFGETTTLCLKKNAPTLKRYS